MDPINVFLELIGEATAGLDNPYFTLPIHGQDLPIYRERVYCYELYHQLRSRWPRDWPYVLNGEVDKSAHPIMRGPGIENAKPDLLVHTPGDMAGNLVIIEVKAIDGNDIQTDVEKLAAFCTRGGYRRGVLLFFGPHADGLTVIQRKLQRASGAVGVAHLRELTVTLWQPAPVTRAVDVPWLDAAV